MRNRRTVILVVLGSCWIPQCLNVTKQIETATKVVTPENISSIQNIVNDDKKAEPQVMFGGSNTSSIGLWMSRVVFLCL